MRRISIQRLPCAPVVAPPTIKRTTPVLSRRQQQVLVLLIQGESEKTAADALGVSQHTVHVYVKQLYESFRVRSRGQLMSRMFALLCSSVWSDVELHIARHFSARFTSVSLTNLAV